MLPGWSGSADVILALLPWGILFGMRQSLSNKERLGIALAMSMGVVYVFLLMLAINTRLADTSHSAGAASFVKMVMLPNLTGDPSMHAFPAPVQRPF